MSFRSEDVDSAWTYLEHMLEIIIVLFFIVFRGIPGGQYSGDETVGIAFSPDRLRFYAGYQDEGVLFEITREDGQVFN